LSSPARELCVAHLVRRGNPISAFQEFLDSYARFPAGIAHDLLIILKGFSNDRQLSPYEALLDGIRHRRVFLKDVGFDVGAYLKVAREHDYRFFLFINSFSRIQVAGWLESMYRHAIEPGIGIVGATGSHQSISSDFHALRWESRPSQSQLRWIASLGWRHARFYLHIRDRFPAFPNYHVRTNAFLVSRAVLTGLRGSRISNKWDAYRYESGGDGMTQQILGAGLIPVVVGADGRAYRPAQWQDARTFWISDQENLLISDNQTRAYSEGSSGLRERLAFHAWRTRPDGTPRTDPAPFAR
jgi:hypothetical protein